MYYIGIDGGGTKTQFTLFDQKGQMLSTHQEGTCHYAQVGYDGLKDVLKKGVKRVLKKVDEKIDKSDVRIGLGLAGYGREAKVREKIEAMVDKALNGYAWVLKNDVEIALKGALDENPGILVIAGTGSIALAYDGKQTTRTGGWGYQLGDEGGAYWIGQKVLEAFTKQSDGRMEKTPLYSLVKEQLNLAEDPEIVSVVQQYGKNHRREVAKLALCCSKASQMGDEIAIAILDQAAKELALLVNTLVPTFDSDRILASYIGGVFRSGDYLMASFIRYLDDKVLLIGPRHTPDYGAYLFAKEQFEK